MLLQYSVLYAAMLQRCCNVAEVFQCCCNVAGIFYGVWVWEKHADARLHSRTSRPLLDPRDRHVIIRRSLFRALEHSRSFGRRIVCARTRTRTSLASLRCRRDDTTSMTLRDVTGSTHDGGRNRFCRCRPIIDPHRLSLRIGVSNAIPRSRAVTAVEIRIVRAYNVRGLGVDREPGRSNNIGTNIDENQYR